VKVEDSCDDGTELYIADQRVKEVGYLIDYLIGRSGFDSQRRQDVFLWFTNSRLALRPIKPPIL
jgi:hypothetical protein